MSPNSLAASLSDVSTSGSDLSGAPRRAEERAPLDTAIPIRVLLADDHAMVRSGLSVLIRSQPDIEVVGEAEDAVGAVRLTRELQPDIVVLDINMPPGDSGLRVIGEVLETSKGSKVLVLTMYDDPTYLQAAIGAGALGYVVKAAADEELISAIRILSEGRTFFSVTHLGEDKDNPPRPPDGLLPDLNGLLPELSRRECQVIYYVAYGYTSQQIADQLGLSSKTVEGYRSRITEKLGLGDRADLVRFALRKGILRPDRPVPRSL